MSSLQRRRVALVHAHGNLDSIPSLTSAATLLAEHGYAVDLLTHPSDSHCAPVFADPAIATVPLDDAATHVRRHAGAFVCLIGVDPAGLAAADDLRHGLALPLAYYSLELLLSHELRTAADWALKARERRLSRDAAFTIIQDDERAALLLKDNGLDPARVLCVPNAPLGPAAIRRSAFLRQRLHLDPARKIILHAGSLAPWTSPAEMVRATAHWPDDWLLVCHLRRRPNAALDTFLADLRRLAPPDRVLFSTEPVAHAEYPALIASADVALAYYFPVPGSPFTQDNLRVLGLSAGKVACALQAGVPLVANDHPSLRRLLATYACGELAADPADNRAALERVLARRDFYSENAVRCFGQEWDFRGRFARVLERLDALAAHTGGVARTNTSPQ